MGQGCLASSLQLDPVPCFWEGCGRYVIKGPFQQLAQIKGKLIQADLLSLLLESGNCWQPSDEKFPQNRNIRAPSQVILLEMRGVKLVWLSFEHICTLPTRSPTEAELLALFQVAGIENPLSCFQLFPSMLTLPVYTGISLVSHPSSL